MSFFARLKVPCFTAALMLVMVLIRVVYGAAVELRAGEAALAGRDLEGAIAHFEKSLHWYVPFSPMVSRAAEQLWTLGQAAEARGETAQALAAYEALRGSFYAARSFYTPHPEWIAKANDRIAQLQAQDRSARWPDPALSTEARKAVAMAALTRDDAPDPLWSVVAVLGFLGWVGAALGFMLEAFDGDGRFLRRPGLRWGVGVVAGYALWVVGLMRA